jgi:hypothetical protein
MSKKAFIGIVANAILVSIILLPYTVISGNYEYTEDVKKAEKRKSQLHDDMVWRDLRARIGEIYEVSPGILEKNITFYEKNNPKSRTFVVKQSEMFTILDGHVRSGCSQWLSFYSARPARCSFGSNKLMVIYEVEFLSGKLAYIAMEYPPSVNTGHELVIDNLVFIRKPTEDEAKKIMSDSKRRRGGK